MRNSSVIRDQRRWSRFRIARFRLRRHWLDFTHARESQHQVWRPTAVTPVSENFSFTRRFTSKTLWMRNGNVLPNPINSFTAATPFVFRGRKQVAHSVATSRIVFLSSRILRLMRASATTITGYSSAIKLSVRGLARHITFPEHKQLSAPLTIVSSNHRRPRTSYWPVREKRHRFLRWRSSKA